MDEILEKLKTNSREKHIPIIKDDSREFLKQFVKNQKPATILEIGTAVGYSGALMLQNCDAKLTTIEINEQSFNKAKETFESLNISNRVFQILGDAGQIIKNMNQKFDFIFLDGPKGQYLTYYPILKSLLNINGYIIADNVLFHGLVNGPVFVKHKLRTLVVNLRKFLEFVKNDTKVDFNIQNIGDGIAVIKKISE